MKRYIIVLVALWAALALSACGSAPVAESASASPADGALPELTQLAIGTFKLEGTEHAISVEQAFELSLLWRALGVLADSDATAPAEIEALESQIVDAMTVAQKAAIDDMGLVAADMTALIQTQGIGMGGGASSVGTGGSASGARPGGGESIPGTGGGPGGSETGLDPEQAEALMAERAAAFAGTQSATPTPLIEAVVELLQAKA